MVMIRLAFFLLIAAIAAGCSSNPPREASPQDQAGTVESSPGQTQESFVSLPDEAAQGAEEISAQPGDDAAAQPGTAPTTGELTPKQQYQALATLPEADSRALKFRLSSQTFNYTENGELVVSGPIASGKASSPTPTGKFRVLSKNKDKESSKYDNEIGTPAWMPYSMQFYGNYFLHEGYLPGQPASHGCIRLGHDHARLLFERMKIGDPVVVSK